MISIRFTLLARGLHLSIFGVFFFLKIEGVKIPVKDEIKHINYIQRCRCIYYEHLFPIRSAGITIFYLGPINTRTRNYSAKYLFYRYNDVAAMILPVTGFHLECAKINRVESDNYAQ